MNMCPKWEIDWVVQVGWGREGTQQHLLSLTSRGRGGGAMFGSEVNLGLTLSLLV